MYVEWGDGVVCEPIHRVRIIDHHHHHHFHQHQHHAVHSTYFRILAMFRRVYRTLTPNLITNSTLLDTNSSAGSNNIHIYIYPVWGSYLIPTDSIIIIRPELRYSMAVKKHINNLRGESRWRVCKNAWEKCVPRKCTGIRCKATESQIHWSALWDYSDFGDSEREQGQSGNQRRPSPSRWALQVSGTGSGTG